MKRILIPAALAAALLTTACETTGTGKGYSDKSHTGKSVDGPRGKSNPWGVKQADF